MDGRSKIPYLPGDIVNSIFLKLPVKSLSRFKSCCKSWHCCVDDADFIKSHLLGKYKLIPNSLLSQKNKNRCSTTSPIFGFAYDFVAEDYKVICAHYLINEYFNVVEVYSIKNQCWRTIHNTFPPSHRYLDNNQVSLNGVIHRMSLNRAVISFHLVDEKFIVTPVPRTCGERPTLHALGDGVCVFTTVGEENLIWSLEKDRWNCINKFPTLDSLIVMSYWSLIGDVTPNTVGIFLFVKENGNILWRRYDGSFIEYGPRKNEYTEFKLTQVPYFGRTTALYVESLVSLKISWD
ncbi:hypothetical protein H5410_006021 [Solanum commersonii]|uniref:F-box domain-containing protein n=1 Tax=Solanum commersonii TaxID=4109 RepID=A0A9J6A945_SOLCO|nr:hypothetical protein H5410_006021 [Solanum commersonii]